MAFRTTVVTSATGEPVTVADLKSQLRITSTDEDTEIAGFGLAARKRLEKDTGMVLMPQTRRVYLDQWTTGGDGYGSIKIPHHPLRGVGSTGIVYTDSDGDSTTWGSTNWSVDDVSMPGRIVLDANGDYPSATLANDRPIAIDFTCGYTTATIPGDLQLAIKMLTGHYYENRENSYLTQFGGGGVTLVPMTYQDIVNDYTDWTKRF